MARLKPDCVQSRLMGRQQDKKEKAITNTSTNKIRDKLNNHETIRRAIRSNNRVIIEKKTIDFWTSNPSSRHAPILGQAARTPSLLPDGRRKSAQRAHACICRFASSPSLTQPNRRERSHEPTWQHSFSFAPFPPTLLISIGWVLVFF